MSWPGVVFTILLGVMAGAVLAFFRARALRDVGYYLIVGVVGFSLGQVLRWLHPLAAFDIGIVNVVYGLVGVMALSFLTLRLRLI